MHTNQQQIERTFTRTTLTDEQRATETRLLDAARNYANVINEACPESREKEQAITALQETALWANAAVAIGTTEGQQQSGRTRGAQG